MLLTVNGATHQIAGDPARPLVTVLRDDLALRGTKPACGEGVCGACTVLVDGDPVRSCVTAVGSVEGRSIVTIEGLTPTGSLSAVQQAFLAERAFQCGYCTPGLVVATSALLEHEGDPSTAAAIEALEGHVCRCGVQSRILRAVARAAARPRLDDPGPTLPRSAAASAPIDAGRVPWDRRAPDERGYFEALGDGLVVVLPPPAGETDWADAWSTPGGTWLHVGSDGIATAFTGKVEMGQNISSALASIVGAAVGLDVAAVRLVTADTDVCPYDEGTFGSRTIPDAGSMLRAAALTAHEVLIGIAADRFEASPSDLILGDGAVRSRDGAREAWIGDLLVGVRRIETVVGRPTGPSGPTDPSRPASSVAWDGADAVTGRRAFVSDMAVPGMLIGRQLQPPVASAELRSADVSEARRIPGVTVVEAGDVVAVAASDVATADRAIAAITAEWAMPDVPPEAELVAHLRAHPAAGEDWDPPVDEAAGDVEAAFERSDVRVEATYTTAYVAHVPLEGRSALATWAADRVTVWTATQTPFSTRVQLAAALGLDEDDVRVIVPPMGAGFGGKHGAGPGVAAALLARASGRPVSCRWRQADEFVRGHVRPAAVIDVRAGAAADGTLLAWDFLDVNAGAQAIRLPYRVVGRRLRYQPAASPLPQDSYRGLAATANTFARETAIDELADALGRDPLAFRLANADDDRLAECLATAADAAGWKAGRTARAATGNEARRGLGIAGSIEKDARVATCVEVSVTGDGVVRVTRIVTAFDCGEIVDAANLTSQVEGATVMALGPALFEAVRLDPHGIANGSLGAYRVPRFSDVPPIEVILVDRPGIPSAGGGEVPLIAVAPAVGNAIHRATGRRLRAMPLVPTGLVSPVEPLPG